MIESMQSYYSIRHLRLHVVRLQAALMALAFNEGSILFLRQSTFGRSIRAAAAEFLHCLGHRHRHRQRLCSDRRYRHGLRGAAERWLLRSSHTQPFSATDFTLIRVHYRDRRRLGQLNRALLGGTPDSALRGRLRCYFLPRLKPCFPTRCSLSCWSGGRQIWLVLREEQSR